MKLMQSTLLASLLSVSFSAMANNVTIENTSKLPIIVKYQFAYHNPGESVVLKDESKISINGNSKTTITVYRNGYDHAGIVVVAVKAPSIHSKWATLPRYFDVYEKPGCWVSTDLKQKSGNINLAVFYYGKKQGRVTCNVSNR